MPSAVMYPLYGIWLSVVSPGYQRLAVFNPGVLISAGMSVAISPVFIPYALRRQHLLLSKYMCHYHEQSAWLHAFVLTLAENTALIQLLNPMFCLLDRSRTDMFDAVLLKYQFHTLVQTSRNLKTDVTNEVQALSTYKSTYTYQPWSLLQMIDIPQFFPWKWNVIMDSLGYQIVFYLPLLLIPYVGVPAFFLLCGRRLRRFLWTRWFVLNKLVPDRQEELLRRCQLGNTGFGMLALALELVPVLSYYFSVTNAAAAAAWAAEQEKTQEYRGQSMQVDKLDPEVLSVG